MCLQKREELWPCITGYGLRCGCCVYNVDMADMAATFVERLLSTSFGARWGNIQLLSFCCFSAPVVGATNDVRSFRALAHFNLTLLFNDLCSM
jgi:hypothetical protein